MHDAGVEFHDTFFIRQATVADRVIVGIIFHDGDGGDDRIKSVAATIQNVHALLQSVHAICRRDDHGALPGGFRCKCKRRALGARSAAEILPATACRSQRASRKVVQKNLRRVQRSMKTLLQRNQN